MESAAQHERTKRPASCFGRAVRRIRRALSRICKRDSYSSPVSDRYLHYNDNISHGCNTRSQSRPSYYSTRQFFGRSVQNLPVKSYGFSTEEMGGFDACNASNPVSGKSESEKERFSDTLVGKQTCRPESHTATTLPHLQAVSSDHGSSRRDSCSPVPSLNPVTATKSETFRRANSLPDILLKNSFEEFTPDIDENDETYRFQCSFPGLYQCSVTGLLFHMEGEGDVVYRTVPWDRRLLAQHHKQPAGPLFDIKCVQQSMCQLHLLHCEIRSTGGCEFLSVAHLKDEGIEFIAPHKITETHVVINIKGFSGFGNVKDEDSPPALVRAQALLFYRPPVNPGLTSHLNVLLLPRNVVLWNVQRFRRRAVGEENFIEASPNCKLHPKQEYKLSTCPEDQSVLVQPKEADFDCDNYNNFFSTFEVILKNVILDIKLLLKDTNSSHVVWEREVYLSSTGVKRSCVQVNSDDSLLEMRSSFIDRISGPVLKSLLDKMFEKKVMTDSERETADETQGRGDKARFVFDTVRNKGEAAISEMTEFLLEVDPFLSEHLGLT